MGPDKAASSKKRAGNEKRPAKQAGETSLKRSKDVSGGHGSDVPGAAIELQQGLLDVFRTAFAHRLLSADFTPRLQQIKGHLYDRDFEKAFNNDQLREIYAARWSPSRALAYLSVFWDLSTHLSPSQPKEESTSLSESQNDASESQTYKIVCFGGGAGAEVVALAGFCTASLRSNGISQCSGISVQALDIADWSLVLEKLELAVRRLSPHFHSDHASGDDPTSDSSQPFTVGFQQCDVLDLSIEELEIIVTDTKLITVMFTLNELYTSSMAKTTKLLLNLGLVAQPGTLLLVVDSPGSYSTVSIGKDAETTKKEYPMQWLLNRTILGDGDEDGDGQGQPRRWEKVMEDDSKWFRLPDGLHYRINLENMRYQIHLYRLL